MKKNNIEGYKCFNKNLMCNHDDFIMEPNKLYVINDEIKVKKKGFHFCIRLEDTLRYFGDLNDEKEICKIKALGDIEWDYDEYNGYYDIGCTNKIYIVEIMSREDIIEYVNSINDNRFIRFITSYKLNKEELMYFKNKYKNNIRVMNYINYYQEEIKDAFEKKYTKILKNK